MRPRDWIAGLFVLTLTAQAAAAVTVTDDRGKAVTLPVPAQRIVALAPSVTELVYAAGAGARLVGAARYSDYPPAAANVAPIGDASRIDLERVLSLKPDLIIGWKSGNHAADVEQFEQFGFAVFMVEPETLRAISRSLRAIGTLAGTAATAQRTADEVEQNVAVLRERYAARATVRVFYEIWHEPLMTVNGRHIISDVIRLCGGVNVFAALTTLTPVVSLEGVIAAQPEVVLGGSSATTVEEFAAQWRRHQGFVGLRGVSALYVDADRIQRQTPRIMQGAQSVCEHLEKIREGRFTSGKLLN